MSLSDDEEAEATRLAAAASISPLSGSQGQWASKFIQVALRTSFGPIVQVVGESLMNRGAQTLDELHRHTQLDYPTLKKVLLTLVQQDIVLPRYEPVVQRPGARAADANKKPRPPRVVYALQLESVRHRSRYAHYLLWIKQCFGPECEYILQTLLVHGKLSSAQVMQLTFASMAERSRLAQQEQHKQMLAAQAAEAAASGVSYPKAPPPPPPAGPTAVDRKRIHDVFRQLIASSYICRAKGLTKPEDAAAVAARAAAAAASAGSGSGNVNSDILGTFLANSAAAQAKEDSAREAAEAADNARQAQEALAAQKAISGAAGKKRKKGAAADEDEEAEEGGGAAGAKPAAKRQKKKTKKELEAEAREAKQAEIRAQKEKEDADVQASLERAGAAAAAATDPSSDGAAEEDQLMADLQSDAHILWTVNHSQFLWEFRKKAVIDYVLQTHSAACSFVVAQMLYEYKPEVVALSGATQRAPIFDTDQIHALCERAANLQDIVNPVQTEEQVEACCHQLLGDSTLFFERKVHPPGYVINFNSLFEELRLKHIQSLCRSRYGSLSARIFRCLLEHHRLEETQLSELCTAPRKEVRRLLYTMHRAQLVSLQDVPRTADRMPQKTFYLWGVPREAVCQHYLETLYFSWCNLRVRALDESERAKPVLDKVDTARRISEQEKQRVEQWKKAADRMEMGMHHINQIIMLFHDF